MTGHARRRRHRALVLAVSLVVLAGCGGRDRTFDGDGELRLDFHVTDVVAEPGGGVVSAGVRGNDLIVSRLGVEGPDRSYGNGSGRFVLALAGEGPTPVLALRPGGGVMVAGFGQIEGGVRELFVLALTASGQLDPGFGQGGASRLGDIGRAGDLLVRSDGRVLLAGAFRSERTTGILLGLDSGGRRDPSFGREGLVTTRAPILYGSSPFAAGVVLLADGSAVIAGGLSRCVGRGCPPNTGDLLVQRYLTDGTQDESYAHPDTLGQLDIGGYETGSDIALAPDGSVVVAGGDLVVRYRDGRGDPRFGYGGIVRLPSSGTFDVDLTDVVVSSDGRLTVVGSSARVPSATRLRPDGRLDSSFGIGGTERSPNENGTLVAAAMLPDGKVIAGSNPNVQPPAPPPPGVLVRYTA